jgi:hypothetical protein
MSDEDLKSKVAEGFNAEEFISNQRYQKAKTLIRADLFRQFTKTKYKDSDERDEIWRKLQSLEWMENNLEKAIRDGEIARNTLLQNIKDKIA